MSNKELKGTIVALVTPFKDDKRLDMDNLSKLIQWHIDKKTDAILICGTTGESATLTHAEHMDLIEFAIKEAAGRIPIIAGAGSNCTEESIMLAKHAEKFNADAILVITPYYNKPTQEGLFSHFKAVAETVRIPVILYNVPSRTGVNLAPETVKRLMEIENILSIKEATGDLRQLSQIIKLCGNRITLLSGDDFTLLPTLSIGGEGVVSVVANIVPEDVKKLIDEYKQGNIKEAEKMHYKLLPLIEVLFIETNPVPVKEAMKMMNLLSSSAVRLPLVPLQETNRKKLKVVLQEYGLINN